ncbi:MAG TPA: C1 family peptidase [Thermoguttaceae bacterium]|nr:C1 family peptidase [Thermoguttaceae bacterium]
MPDPRDYTLTSPRVRPILEPMGFRKGKGNARLPKRVDLRDENLPPPPQDQGPLGSSCAFAVLDLVEYLERKHLGRSLEASKLFLHQLTVRLASSRLAPSATRSVGTTLRTTFKALARFGAPPARFWPYDPGHFDREPTHPLLFSFTREYASLQYFRLDTSTCPTGQVRASPQKTLRNVKRLLALGIPCVCGVAVPRSLTTAPHIPLPNGRDELLGGQAVLILGHQDADPDTTRTKSRQKSPPPPPNYKGQPTGGALLIRPSWGTRWGKKGYGWLPEAYVAQGFASDFWTAMKPEWSRKE